MAGHARYYGVVETSPNMVFDLGRENIVVSEVRINGRLLRKDTDWWMTHEGVLSRHLGSAKLHVQVNTCTGDEVKFTYFSQNGVNV